MNLPILQIEIHSSSDFLLHPSPNHFYGMNSPEILAVLMSIGGD